MSVRARQALAVIVAALVAVVAPGTYRLHAARSSAAPTHYAPFPERIVARASRLPQYADGPSTRIRQQVDSASAMWRSIFAADGDEYTAPRLSDRVVDGCAPRGSWAGLYCTRDHVIVIDLPGHLDRIRAAGGGLSDLVLGYIVAHEVGHHVQELRGAPATADPLKRELHADCLAGVWGKAAGLPLPPTWLYGEDAVHGTALQRIRWLNRGYLRARPADCDTIWSGSTSP